MADTPRFTLRLPEKLREAAQAEADAHQTSLSVVILWALRARYPFVETETRRPPLRRERRPAASAQTEELPIASNG